MKKILLALFIITIFLFGCAKQPASQPEELSKPVEEPGTPPESVSEPIPSETGKGAAGKGTLNLLVSDQNNVVSDFDFVRVAFNHVKVYKPKSSEPVEKDIDVMADVTELQGNNALKLLELDLEAGKYSKIKLYASSTKGSLLGNEIEITIPGDAITVDKDFEIKDKKRTTFVVDLEVIKTKKVTTTTGLGIYNLQPAASKSGIVPVDITFVKEITPAEMILKINEKAGKKFDRRVFMTQEKGFTPYKMTIETGTKVIWENKDSKKLGIIMGGVLDTFIRAGGSFEHTFNRAGTYPYNMKFYLSNKGEITVTSPEQPKKEEAKPTVLRTVEIRSTGFSPAIINIQIGTQVRFVNKDTKYHHLTISGEPLIQTLATNEEFDHVYSQAGEFYFNDAYNVKDYSGKVVVT